MKRLNHIVAGSVAKKIIGALLAALFLSGCSAKLTPIKAVTYVDINRFMGDWYVIASIPTIIEEGAHNAVESYKLDPDGTIATTFTFRQDSFEGQLKTYRPRGFIHDKASNAVWGMQFLWPIKAEYLITYLDEGYTRTIISRTKRDYVWIMARKPAIPDEDYKRLVEEVSLQGYNIDKLKKVPQRWPDTGR
ncbi:MAG: hypothetical protein HPY65_18070 [Syntrophaceae bacterium]|nr:hypothetical protein [Syntrophaceae bacterium]